MGGGFIAGIEHPVFGLDHVVAMVAVGMWGAQLGAPAIWVLPVTFPLVMAFGGVLGVAGVPIPGVEIGIAVSAIVLGGMIASAETAAVGCGRIGRSVRNLSRLCPRRRVARVGQCDCLRNGLRGRHRIASRARHFDRHSQSLAERGARAAGWRRPRSDGGRLFPGQGPCRLAARAGGHGGGVPSSPPDSGSARSQRAR